jgi:hypothetical protein
MVQRRWPRAFGPKEACYGLDVSGNELRATGVIMLAEGLGAWAENRIGNGTTELAGLAKPPYVGFEIGGLGGCAGSRACLRN